METTRTRVVRAAAVLVLLCAGGVAAGAGPAAGAATGGVPWYHQLYRSDCEASALRMVMAARGRYAGDVAVLARIGVDRVHYRFGVSGPLSGDPFRAFVGDPAGDDHLGTGFGVYAPPVAKAARAYGLDVLAAGQGITLARLRAEAGRGHPAVVWVDFRWRYVRAGWYVAYDGRRVPYAGPHEHAVVVTGVDGGRVAVNDPWRGRYTLSEAAFEAGYRTYGEMAVVIR